ncbi:FG-GAP repeat domain-containing protein [Paractinoplanes atraurantiacus]|uniref:Repeat domain-containing protein n=1 Tax=Paractinoplanes atraurantiacus TaxID=1036182 RepID=A0A285K5F0_9ACTN|nr:VCBS repeat-containing protein [Actinoplanes atraurantiacus]SNY67812.1 Repeat domain-containing protein [Actinoplanes atraurantiacus]
MKNAYRRTLAAMVGGALAAAAGTSVPAPAMAATTPHEVTVVPAEKGPPNQTSLNNSVAFAGKTGVLHRRTSTSPWLWTRYSDRRSVVVSALTNVPSGGVAGLFGDTVEVLVSTADRPVTSTLRWTLDLDAMTWHRVDLPFNGSVYNARPVGDALLQVRPDFQIELRRPAGDGSDTTTLVTGVPDGTNAVRIETGDDRAAVLRFHTSAGYQYGLLDAATSRVAPIPGSAVALKVVLSGDRVGLFTGPAVRTFSRDGITDGTDSAATVFTVAAVSPSFGLAGDDLITVSSFAENGWLKVQRQTPDGAKPTPVANTRLSTLTQGPDSVLFAGGTGDGSDWALRKVTAEGQEVVTPVIAPTVNAGVSLSSGRLRHVTASQPIGEGTIGYHPYSYSIGPSGVTGRTDDKAFPDPPQPCETDAACVRTLGGHDWGMPWISGTTLNYQDGGQTGSSFAIPSTGSSVVDASYRYTLINGGNPKTQYVDLNSNGVVYSGPVTGAALWFRTLWRATKAGTLQAFTLPIGPNDPATAGATVTTGSACTATEVQATAKYLYWACGATGPAGVYDLTLKANIALPAGQYLLGDNYVVRHNADGTLVRYEITGGKLGEPATLATFDRGPLADDRNVNWAVDKFGGDVAWVDSDNAVHIVDPGVTPSAPAVWTEYDFTYEQGTTTPSVWSVRFRFTRPVTASRVIITQARTGKVVYDSTTGAVPVTRQVSWNGLVGGKRATSGTYRWQLVSGTTTLGSGSFLLSFGTPTLHAIDRFGFPSVLGVLPSGAGHWLASSPSTAALRDSNGATETWNRSKITALVPYGDINRDAKNDLLVRFANGTMRVYLGYGRPAFDIQTSVAVPGNWNRFNQIVHTGDLTGDGVSDLLARETSTGRLFRFTGNGKGGFSSSAAYGGTYKGVSRFVGPGDITGDGKADLIAIYGTTMYAWYGDGKGGFTPGMHLIGSGYLGFNTIIGAGDLNEDGKNDLLMRNSAGVLWRKLGNGKGGFGALQLVGTGYQKYAALY